MAEGAPGHKPKFSIVEVAAVTIVLLILDVVDWFSFGVPASDLTGFPGLQGYMRVKKVGQLFVLIVNLLELVPGLDYLPLRTTAFLMIVWADRHPESKLAKVIAKAEKVEAAVESRVPGAEAIGGAAGGAAAKANLAAAGARTAPGGAVAAAPAALGAVGGSAAGAREAVGAAEAGAPAGGGPRRVGKRYSGTLRQGREAGGPDSGEEEELPEDSGLSPEEKELEEILSGDYVGRLLRESLEFDPNQEIRQGAANDNGYNKEVDLREAA